MIQVVCHKLLQWSFFSIRNNGTFLLVLNIVTYRELGGESHVYIKVKKKKKKCIVCFDRGTVCCSICAYVCTASVCITASFQHRVLSHIPLIFGLGFSKHSLPLIISAGVCWSVGKPGHNRTICSIDRPQQHYPSVCGKQRKLQNIPE